jgi:arylsulfatase A-like enzyme
VDTLRQDHVGSYGHARATTPSLDALTGQATTFRNAYAVSPWTLPSVTTVFTGLHPRRHGATDFAKSLSGEAVTLAETLQANGFATAAVVANLLLTRKYGLDQGFERWDQAAARGHEYVSTPVVTETAIRFLEDMAKDERRFLLFVHYFDPHFQYRSHPEYGFARPRSGRVSGEESLQELRGFFGTMTGDEVGVLLDRYDEEIRFADAGIGRLLARLGELGLDDDTLIIVLADHGEEFHGRGWVGHTRTLYDEVMRVPLIVRDPRRPRRAIVDHPVSLAGVTPTLLDLLGVSRADRSDQGESFASAVLGGAAAANEDILLQVDFQPHGSGGDDKAAFKKALIRESWKIIHDDSTGVRELYDLESDPGERVNLASEHPDLLASLDDALRVSVTATSEGALDAPEVALPAGRMEELRALGYAGN